MTQKRKDKKGQEAEIGTVKNDKEEKEERKEQEILAGRDSSELIVSFAASSKFLAAFQ